MWTKLSLVLCIAAVIFTAGYATGSIRKQCATATGQRIVSSDSNFCYYVNSTYGQAITKRKAK